MEIVYCDDCGFRIPEEQFASGRVKRGDRTICVKCQINNAPDPDILAMSRKHGHTPDGGVARKTLSRTTPDAGIARRMLPSTTVATSGRDTPSGSRHAMPPQPEKSNTLALKAGGAIAVVFTLIYIISSNAVGRPKLPAAPPAQESTSQRYIRQKNEETRKPGADNDGAPAPATAVPNVRPAEPNQLEREAEAAFEKLRAYENEDREARIKRLQEFADRYQDTILAARVRREINELKHGGIVTAPAPAPPATAGPVLSYGERWLEIADVEVKGTVLTVRLGNNADGYIVADAVKVQNAKGQSKIIDESDPGCNFSPGWVASRNDSYRYSREYTGEAKPTQVVTWTIPGLTFDRYKVFVTWFPHENRATNAPYEVLEGTQVLATANVNQKQPPPKPDAPATPLTGPATPAVPVTPPPAASTPATKLDASAQIAAYQSDLLDLLRKGDVVALSKHIKAAAADETLAEIRRDIERDQILATWMAELSDLALKGAAKLKSVNAFDLLLSKGEVMRVGKRSKYQVVDVKDGSLFLSNAGVDVSLPLDSILPQCRDELIDLGLGSDAQSELRRAFLAAWRPEGSPTAAKAALDKALGGGVPAEDVAVVQRLLSAAAKRGTTAASAPSAALESAAAIEWREITRSADARQWKQVLESMSAWRTKFAATKFCAGKVDEMKALAVSAADAQNVEAGMLAYWKFDEFDGTAVPDSAAGKHKLTVHGKPEWVAGISGRAISLNNKTDYCSAANAAELQSLQQGDYSLAAWVKPDIKPSGSIAYGQSGIVMKTGAHEGLSYDPGARFQMIHWLRDNNVAAKSARTFAPGAFCHVVGVVSKKEGVVKIYVNGVLEGKENFEAGSHGRDYREETWKIGTGSPLAPQYTWPLKGTIDEVRLYKRALNDVEAHALFTLKPK
jgi:hypothetical protein